MAQKLKIAVKPTFSAPVLMPLAADDGKVTEIRFTATFKRLGSDETRSVQERLAAGELTDKELLDLVLADWAGLVDDAETPFICTPENRASAVQDWPSFEASLARSYFQHAYPAAAKN